MVIDLRQAIRTSLDEGYETGQISVFPDAADSRHTLYEARNNAETRLTQTLTYTGKNVFVEDASDFPSSGLLRIGPPPGVPRPGEILYYQSRTNRSFTNLVRGLVGTRRNQWEKGSYATCSVMAEHHNAVKDAVFNLQTFLGTKIKPDEESLHGRLKALEAKHLAPKPMFRAYPISGTPPLTVRFQNFSNSDVIRFLWDFGDGTQSIERNPVHTYLHERFYTIRLHIVTAYGAQGIVRKDDYIQVSNQDIELFFYVEQLAPRHYLFIDQTDGEILQRYWVFGDGTPSQMIDDPNIHTIEHTYADEGEYNPSLLVVFADQTIRRVYSEKLVVE